MPAQVAWSRMYRGEHHPLDIAGGLLLALLWLAAVIFAVRPNADLDESEPSPLPLTSSPAVPALPAPADGIHPGQPSRQGGQQRGTGTRSAVVANPAKVKNRGPSQRQVQAVLSSGLAGASLAGDHP